MVSELTSPPMTATPWWLKPVTSQTLQQVARQLDEAVGRFRLDSAAPDAGFSLLKQLKDSRMIRASMKLTLSALTALTVCPGPARAADDALSISGFATLAAGKVCLGGVRTDDSPLLPLPLLHIADQQPRRAVHAERWQIKQETKVSVQGTYHLQPEAFLATAQVVGAGVTA